MKQPSRPPCRLLALVGTVCVTVCVCVCVCRYGQYDPYDRPEASLGYNMDENELVGDYNHLYSQQQQQRANGHADYYRYASH